MNNELLVDVLVFESINFFLKRRERLSDLLSGNGIVSNCLD